MKLEIITVVIAALVIIAIACVLLTPSCTDPDRIEATAEAGSAIATAAGIIILIIQNWRETKQRTEATIRTEMILLFDERQRLESDVTQIDIARSNQGDTKRLMDRRRCLEEDIKKVSSYFSYMLDKHKDALRDIAFFKLPPDELKKECLKEYVQCLDKARENQKTTPS